MNDKKEDRLTDFLRSIPEDPTPEEMLNEEPAFITIYDEWGNVLEERTSGEPIVR